MKAFVLALALFSQVDAITLSMQNSTANATASANATAAATPTVYTDGPNKNVGY